jgi:glycosyltransferase involved in cell wall biosynthesis
MESALSPAKIFFHSTVRTPFVEEDLTTLKKHFEVRFSFACGPAAVPAILSAVPRADLTFNWFASVYSFVAVSAARLAGKKSLVVLGGVDVAKEPEIGYGLWLSPWKGALVGRALRHADAVLSVDPSLSRQAAARAKYSGRNIEYVPTGYDSRYWVPLGSKQQVVLTVAGCRDTVRARAKGIDFLCTVARNLPDVRFRLVGVDAGIDDWVRSMAPPTMEILPFLSREELRREYQSAKVYCQPSFAEGLPNSLCEAMLCGCVPVGTDVGGIPTAVGGRPLARYGDVTGLGDLLREALAAPESVGLEGRDRIAKTFTCERRESELIRIISRALG